jgi:hypothetical protein
VLLCEKNPAGGGGRGGGERGHCRSTTKPADVLIHNKVECIVQ